MPFVDNQKQYQICQAQLVDILFRQRVAIQNLTMVLGNSDEAILEALKNLREMNNRIHELVKRLDIYVSTRSYELSSDSHDEHAI